MKHAALLPTLLYRLDESPIEQVIENFRPDHIIATHFFPGLFLNRQVPLTTVVTDYAIHEFWLAGNPDHMVVSTDTMKQQLADRGIPTRCVTVAPIPIHPSFAEEKSLPMLRQKHGMSGAKKTILVLSGGYGLVRTDTIVRTLLTRSEPSNIIAIAGKNQKLRNALEQLTPPNRHTLRAIGWTDALDEYMRLADIVIGKPGGLTTTECIALQKPFIAVNPIPGHEDANVRYLEQNGYGKCAMSFDHLATLLQRNPKDIAPRFNRHLSSEPLHPGYTWKKIVDMSDAGVYRGQRSDLFTV